MATSDIQATEMTSILDTIKNLIPSNPVAAFANGNMLQVLVFAVIVGFTLIAIGQKGAVLLKVIDSCNEVCLKVISTVMYFTPIGVILYNRSGSGGKRYRNYYFPGNPAYYPVRGILWFRPYCLWRSCEIHRQRKPCKIFQSNASGCLKCLWNLLQFCYYSYQQAVYGG